jgi:cytochrome o ubiquinol oxidase subunit IV
MEEELSLKEIQKEWLGSLKAYLIGFFASILLTALSFALVMTKAMSRTALLYTISALALVQAFFQVKYFLHVGEEPKPRWEMGIFFFMVMVLMIIVIGTLWIMYNLDQRVMPDM